MNKYIPERNTTQVAAGTVESMYSPAAYLTELWKNAVTLHPDGHPYALTSRRPDISLLALNQDNMDSEVSVLNLSNQLLLSAMDKYVNKNQQPVLARYVVIRSTPYDLERNTISWRELEVFSQNQNIALGKKIVLAHPFYPNMADDMGPSLVDGNPQTGNDFLLMCKGDGWLLVDLEKTFTIDKITLTGGGGGGRGKLLNQIPQYLPSPNPSSRHR